jgi:hypothetical protein
MLSSAWFLTAANPLVGESSRLSDRDYWHLMSSMSEEGGSFVSDNIISNEIDYQRVIPTLVRVPPGRAYIGVGPEQNFTYIVALKPSIAFIVDLQRSNAMLHLLYKALIEMSNSRTEFVSRLFARSLPSRVQEDIGPAEMFATTERIPVSDRLANDTLRDVLRLLERQHHFPLTEAQRTAIGSAYRSLVAGGPSLRGDYGGGSWIPSYAELIGATDGDGRNRGYLSSENTFQIVRRYERDNLIVPVVGDFAGPVALRAIGTYLREHRQTVGVFYTSNVEEYLFKAGTWPAFVLNLRELPSDESSMIVRTYFTHTAAGLQTLTDTVAGTLAAQTAERLSTYDALVRRSTGAVPERERR